jgi:DNA-binding winged helix-turn-helix (wHTH) protein
MSTSYVDLKTDYCEHCGTLVDRPAQVLSFGNAIVTSDQILIDGNAFRMPPQPHRVLRTIMLRPMLSREALFGAIWGGDSDNEIKIVDVQLCHVRRFLREHGADFGIDTIWGTGYRLRLLKDPPPVSFSPNLKPRRKAVEREVTPTQENKTLTLRARMQARRERRKSYRL